MLIGICGKSGSGKSTIANEMCNTYKLISNSDSILHLDIDKVGHEVLTIKEVQDELMLFFGKDILANNKVNRKKLGELVFASREKMQHLSDITWKYMQEEIDKILENNQNKIIILDWILLTKTKFFNMCDIKILVDTPLSIRKARAVKRDNISDTDFDLREQASVEYNYDDFDFIINNNEKDMEKGGRYYVKNNVSRKFRSDN